MTGEPKVVLTHHARQRIQEMEISVQVIEEILDHPSSTYPGRPGTNTRVVHSNQQPDYIVVVANHVQPADPTVVITVSFNTPGVRYVRDGKTYRLPDPSSD